MHLVIGKLAEEITEAITDEPGAPADARWRGAGMHDAATESLASGAPISTY